jgi:predicted Zn finger-like uncharacterized protein
MLIVCPNCTTSYTIDPTALGAGGRTVRCARCKATWFATPHKQVTGTNAFVDGVVAEAEAQPAAQPVAPPTQDTTSAAAASQDPRMETEHAMPPPPPESPAAVSEAEAASDPVPVSDAPSLVPQIEQAPPVDGAEAEANAEDVESFAARRARMQARRKKSRRTSRWTAILLVLLALNVALIGAREEVVRYLPQTASLFAAIGLPVNLRHLKFENVRISKEAQDGVNILIVEGSIVSDANKPVAVPRLRFAARNASGQEIYKWTALPSRSILGPGEKLEFRSRLASPPADAADIMVRFFNAQDAAAEVK